MSRIGNSAIVIPADVTLSQQGGMIVAKGKNGELSAPLHSEVELSIADNIATLMPKRKTKLALVAMGYNACINQQYGCRCWQLALPVNWKSTVLVIARQCKARKLCLTLGLATRLKWMFLPV